MGLFDCRRCGQPQPPTNGAETQMHTLEERIAALEAGQRREEPRAMAVREMLSLERALKMEELRTASYRESYEEMREREKVILSYTAQLVKAARDAERNLTETRWAPVGDLTAWTTTADGLNHGSVMGALEALRPALAEVPPEVAAMLKTEGE